MKEIQEKHDGIFSGLQDVGPVKVGVRPDQYLMQGEELKKRIQIHHYSGHPSNANYDHWLTSFASSDEPFRVKLYESSKNNVYTPDFRRQIVLFHSDYLDADGDLSIHVYQPGQQKSHWECGMYATAFAVDLSFGLKPEKQSYDNPEKIIDQARGIITGDELKQFSTKLRPGKLHPTKVHSWSIHCLCFKTIKSTMIECFNCNIWFHQKCVRLSNAELKRLETEQNNFICPRCLNSS